MKANFDRKTMKRKMTLSILLALSVLLSVATLPPNAQGHPPQRFKVDPGIVMPSVGQVLRVIVCGVGGVGGGVDDERMSFVWMKYGPAGCNNDGVCRHIVVSQGATAPVTPGTGNALSFDVQGTGNGVRVMVLSNSRFTRVTVQLIDTSTGEVVWVDQFSGSDEEIGALIG